jgi:hypothetical protein
MKKEYKYFLVHFTVKNGFDFLLPNPAIVTAESAEQAKMRVEWEREVSKAISAQELDIDTLMQAVKQ